MLDPDGNCSTIEGYHQYATAMWWVGEPAGVSGTLTRTDDYMVDAPRIVVWRFKNANCLAVFEYSSAPDMRIRAPYYALDDCPSQTICASGTIWVTRCSAEMLDLPPVMLHKGTETVSYQVPMGWIQGFKGAARDFIDGILEGRQPRMDVDDSIKVLRAALAAYTSDAAQRPIDPSTLS